MKTVIVATAHGSVAEAALKNEGLEFEVAVCAGERDYGELLALLWQEGEGFVLVEDDIAPWVGAISQLRECPERWCAFDYSVGRGIMVSVCSHWGLGLTKVSAELVSLYPSVPTGWRGVSWRQLDASVDYAVRAVTGMKHPHVHSPPVAHAQHHRP